MSDERHDRKRAAVIASQVDDQLFCLACDDLAVGRVDGLDGVGAAHRVDGQNGGGAFPCERHSVGAGNERVEARDTIRSGFLGLLQPHVRKRPLSPDRIKPIHELIGRRCPLAERDHVFFDLAIHIAIELGAMVVVRANGVVDRYGGLAKIAALPRGVGTDAGDQGHSRGEQKASIHGALVTFSRSRAIDARDDQNVCTAANAYAIRAGIENRGWARSATPP